MLIGNEQVIENEIIFHGLKNEIIEEINNNGIEIKKNIPIEGIIDPEYEYLELEGKSSFIITKDRSVMPELVKFSKNHPSLVIEYNIGFSTEDGMTVYFPFMVNNGRYSCDSCEITDKLKNFFEQ